MVKCWQSCYYIVTWFNICYWI